MYKIHDRLWPEAQPILVPLPDLPELLPDLKTRPNRDPPDPQNHPDLGQDVPRLSRYPEIMTVPLARSLQACARSRRSS
jgi:hypothetical protein